MIYLITLILLYPIYILIKSIIRFSYKKRVIRPSITLYQERLNERIEEENWKLEYYNDTYRLAVLYMQIQRFDIAESTLNLLYIKTRITQTKLTCIAEPADTRNAIETNIQFCKKPAPFYSESKGENHTNSLWLYIMINLFGYTRYGYKNINEEILIVYNTLKSIDGSLV